MSAVHKETQTTLTDTHRDTLLGCVKPFPAFETPTAFFTVTLIMWKAAVLTMGLLVALVDRAQSNDGHPSFYGMKLCGREFIRAVIFTCGGSRWRRGVGGSGKFYKFFFYDVPCFPKVSQNVNT